MDGVLYTNEIIEISHELETKVMKKIIPGGGPWALGFDEWSEWDNQKKFRFPFAASVEWIFNSFNKVFNQINAFEYKIAEFFKPKNLIQFQNIGVDNYTPDIILSVNFKLLEMYIANINLTEINIWGENTYEEKLLKLFDWWLVRKYSDSTSEDDTKHLIELMKLRVELW